MSARASKGAEDGPSCKGAFIGCDDKAILWEGLETRVGLDTISHSGSSTSGFQGSSDVRPTTMVTSSESEAKLWREGVGVSSWDF